MASAQLVDKTPAAIPNVPAIYKDEPWENPMVDGINRDAARATAYSYPNIADALKGDREQPAQNHCTENGATGNRLLPDIEQQRTHQRADANRNGGGHGAEDNQRPEETTKTAGGGEQQGCFPRFHPTPGAG